MSKATEEKRMIESIKRKAAEAEAERDTHETDKTWENEASSDTTPMVRISLKEYNDLRDQTKYITDPTLIGAIDKIEFFVKELRKHIVRKY